MELSRRNGDIIRTEILCHCDKPVKIVFHRGEEVIWVWTKMMVNNDFNGTFPFARIYVSFINIFS